MPAPIIAAYEPYTDDRAPVEVALAAGKLTGAPVIAAAVHPWPITGEVDPDPRYAEAQRIVVEAVRGLNEDLDIDVRVLPEMSVPRALHTFAREQNAGLVVVGSTRRGRTERVLLGSSAERLLQGSPCAVVLAPRDYVRAPLRTIAVGFVDSPEGHAALTAAHLLARTAEARLRVVSVLHPSGGLDAATAAGLRPQRGALLEGRHRSEAQAALERAVAALGGDVEIESELHVDDPGDVLLRISEHVELLVCGSRGYGPLRSVLLGGVSRQLVNGSRCPVLVLPRGLERPLAELFAVPDAAAAR